MIGIFLSLIFDKETKQDYDSRVEKMPIYAQIKISEGSERLYFFNVNKIFFII